MTTRRNGQIVMKFEKKMKKEILDLFCAMNNPKRCEVTERSVCRAYRGEKTATLGTRVKLLTHIIAQLLTHPKIQLLT